jgi:hypothetical protein
MKFSHLLVSFSLTLALMIVFEVMTSSLLPAIGWFEYRIALNVLVILFMAIRLNAPILPWLIMILQMVHSAFSIEGWALGTLAGIIVMIAANYLKELLQLTTPIIAMVTALFFQFIWFMTVAIVLCLKISSFEKFGMIVWSFVPGSIVLAILSPLIFALMNLIWRVPAEGFSPGVEI